MKAGGLGGGGRRGPPNSLPHTGFVVAAVLFRPAVLLPSLRVLLANVLINVSAS